MKKNLFILAITAIFILLGCESNPTKTIESLKEGIIGESTASAKYKAFADKARLEGLDTIAKLFDATSMSEAIHAANHIRVLSELGEKMDEFMPQFEVKSTRENLQNAIDGESYEIDTMYPGFMEIAKSENVKSALETFTWAYDTEKKHKLYYTKALEALNNSTLNILAFEYYVCPVCGNTYDKASVEPNCAICATPSEQFVSL